MRRSAFSIIAFLLVGGVLLAYSLRQEYSQTIVREFSIPADGDVEIANTFGPVDINTWEQNRVKMTITTTVRAGSEKRAREVFELIRIDFAESPDHVQARTRVDEETSWWGNSDEKKDYSVHYEVWLPATVDLDIRNKYGDVTVAEMKGHTRIELKYGNLQLARLHHDLYLDFSHGTGQIGQIKDLEGKLSYCNLQLARARDIELETEYSNLQIDQAGEVLLNAKYNNFRLGQLTSCDYEGRYDVLELAQVDRFLAIAKYSDFHLASVNESASLDLEFGLARIDQINSGFSEVSLVGRFTDYEVEVASGTPYQLQAAADYAGISYPASLEVTYERESSTYHEVEGYRGGAGTQSVIKAQLNYGGLKVKD